MFLIRTVKSEADIEKLAQERIAEIRSAVPTLDIKGNTYCQHIGKPWIRRMDNESLFVDINNLEKGFAEPDAKVIVARR